MFHLCSIHVPFMFHSCSIHVPFIFHSYSIHIPFIFHSCSIHVPFMFHSCSIHIPFIFHSYSIHIPFMFHLCSIHVPFMFHLCSITISYHLCLCSITISYMNIYNNCDFPNDHFQTIEQAIRNPQNFLRIGSTTWFDIHQKGKNKTHHHWMPQNVSRSYHYQDRYVQTRWTIIRMRLKLSDFFWDQKKQNKLLADLLNWTYHITVKSRSR